MGTHKHATSGLALLSKEDITRLLSDRSTKAQIDLVEKLTMQYAAEGQEALNAEQTAIANDIFHLLLARGDIIVRAMLAMNLSQTDKLQPELARKIASDVSADVALPVLQYSNALSDSDLTAIIHSRIDTQKLEAIAKRHIVSEAVSSILADTKLNSVVNALIQNEGAKITSQTFEKIANNHAGDSEVMESMFESNLLPAAVVTRVIGHLSKELREHLEKKYGTLNELETIRSALDKSLQSASQTMRTLTESDAALMPLLSQLEMTRMLAPFAALAFGNLHLFETSIARLLHVPFKNVQVLLSDAVGFNAAYRRSELPLMLREATALAILSIRTLEHEHLQQTGLGMALTTQAIIARMKQLAEGKKIAGVDQLCALMRHCTKGRL